MEESPIASFVDYVNEFNDFVKRVEVTIIERFILLSKEAELAKSFNNNELFSIIDKLREYIKYYYDLNPQGEFTFQPAMIPLVRRARKVLELHYRIEFRIADLSYVDRLEALVESNLAMLDSDIALMNIVHLCEIGKDTIDTKIENSEDIVNEINENLNYE